MLGFLNDKKNDLKKSLGIHVKAQILLSMLNTPLFFTFTRAEFMLWGLLAYIFVDNMTFW